MADANRDAAARFETERLRQRVRELEQVVAERSAPDQAEEKSRHEATESREQVLELEERLQSLARSGRDAVHALSNDLTLAVGYLELLRMHSALPVELRDLVQGAADGLAAASQHLDELHRRLRAATGSTPES
jgi:hypothetical protein